MSKLLQEISKLLPRSRPDRHESGIAHPIQPARTRGLFHTPPNLKRHKRFVSD